MMKQGKKVLAIILITSAVGIGLVLYILNLAFTEDLYFTKGHIAYFVFTPALIKSIPQPDIDEEAQYHHSCGDGPKPMSEGIRFWSKATRTEVFAQIDEYLIRNGYKPVYENLTYDYEYAKNGNRLGLTIRGSGIGGVEVTVEEMYY